MPTCVDSRIHLASPFLRSSYPLCCISVSVHSDQQSLRTQSPPWTPPPPTPGCTGCTCCTWPISGAVTVLCSPGLGMKSGHCTVKRHMSLCPEYTHCNSPENRRCGWFHEEIMFGERKAEGQAWRGLVQSPQHRACLQSV